MTILIERFTRLLFREIRGAIETYGALWFDSAWMFYCAGHLVKATIDGDRILMWIGCGMAAFWLVVLFRDARQLIARQRVSA